MKTAIASSQKDLDLDKDMKVRRHLNCGRTFLWGQWIHGAARECPTGAADITINSESPDPEGIVPLKDCKETCVEDCVVQIYKSGNSQELTS